MKTLRLTAILFLLIFALTSCNSNIPLLNSLSTDFSDIESITLTDGNGKSVTVTDSADFSELQNYKSRGALPSERETELFDSSSHYLCTFNTRSNSEVGVYIFNSGEIVCYIGDSANSKLYIYKTDGQPLDREHIETLFQKYV